MLELSLSKPTNNIYSVSNKIMWIRKKNQYLFAKHNVNSMSQRLTLFSSNASNMKLENEEASPLGNHCW